MKKTIISIIGLLLLGICANAQDFAKTKEQINRIKKSSQYIYGEATADSEDEAKSIAEDILYQEINSWVSTKKKLKNSSNIIVNNRKELQTAYALPRGNMFRYFVYVKKSDLIPAENVEVLGNINEQSAESMSSTVETISTPAVVNNYPEIVNVIASYTDYYKMADKIKEYKKEGKISHYARYASLEKPEIYYLAIYNPQGKVVAILTPGTERMNVITGQPDKTTNYSGCGAIGFIVNE